MVDSCCFPLVPATAAADDDDDGVEVLGLLACPAVETEVLTAEEHVGVVDGRLVADLSCCPAHINMTRHQSAHNVPYSH